MKYLTKIKEHLSANILNNTWSVNIFPFFQVDCLNGSLHNWLVQGTADCGILRSAKDALFLFSTTTQILVASYDVLCPNSRAGSFKVCIRRQSKRLIRWPRGRGDGAPVPMTHCSHGWPHLGLKLYPCRIMANLYPLTNTSDSFDNPTVSWSTECWYMWSPVSQGAVAFWKQLSLNESQKSWIG